MNHDSDKEMDVLLRRQARRSPVGLAGASAKPGTPHMDADELNAYAEGALSDQLRSRYMLHLADCDSCRKIVTQLLLSSGVEAEESGTVAQTIETPSRSWREWFATLFSPPVLRYAAPVLALAAFASIIFVVVTRNREIPSIVARRDAATQQAPNSDAQERSEASKSTATSNSAVDKEAADSNPNASGAAPGSAAPAPQAARETGPANNSSEADGDSTQGAPKVAELRDTASPPPPVQGNAAEAEQSQPPPAPAAQPADKPFEASKPSDNAGFINQNRRESGDTAQAGASSAAGSGRRGQSAGVTKSSPGSGAMTESSSAEKQKKESERNAPTTTARARRDAAGADEESSETRTVAGKRFRQRNGVWVDTSYNSSRSALRVRRGSEQYRALVADEPIIGTVANSLGGSVIVVAGGRAYHIY